MINTDNIQIPLATDFNENSKKAMIPVKQIKGMVEHTEGERTFTIISLYESVRTDTGSYSDVLKMYLNMPVEEAHDYIEDKINASLVKTGVALRVARLQVS